jgi:hypothetical protein
MAQITIAEGEHPYREIHVENPLTDAERSNKQPEAGRRN